MRRNFYRFATILLIVAMLLTGCGEDPNTEEGATIGDFVEGVEKPQDETHRPSKEEEPEKQPTQEDQTEEQTSEEEKPSEEPEKEPEEPETEPEAQQPVQKPIQKPTEDEEAPDQNEPEQPEQEQPKEEPEEPEEEFEEPEEEYEEEPEEEFEEEPEEEDEEDEEDEESPAVPSTPGVTVKPQTPAVPTPTSVKIASYNIKALMYGKDTAGIIQELKEVNADIVGLQEVDKNTNRSKVNGKKVHQVEMLAKELGYPYWSFDKLIDYQGGEYGMAILSRYPIISSDVVQYEAQEPDDSHIRKYARHVLRLGSKDLAFYNTHLCIRDEEDSVSKLQLKEVTDRMKKDVYSVLTGDLNMQAQTAASVVSQNSILTLLNDGGPGTGKIGSKEASKYIDHIIVSKMMSYPINNSGTGIEVNETPYSDHNLIYTYVSFK